MLLSAVTLGATGTASATQDAADLVLRHGTLYRVSEPGALAGSVAVRGGRLVYVGADDGVAGWIGPRTVVIELHGRALTPGLIDAHAHLEGLGEFLEQVDLGGADSYQEVVRRVAAAAASAPAGAWVRGRGWDQNRWAGKAFPDHAALSAAVPDHPVLLGRVDGHAMLLNARAMRALRLTAAVPDPPGGRILRDAAGEPTGVLVDNAVDVVLRGVPGPGAAERQRHIVRAAKAAAEVGLTTVTDMGIGAESVAAYRALQLARQLPIRVGLFWSGSDPRIGEWMAHGPWA